MFKKAFFLDRDGIIITMVYDLKNGTIDTLNLPGQIKYLDGIFELLRLTHQLGYLNIIISNQPNIALKKISPKNFNLIEALIMQKCKKEQVIIDDFYYCLHHPYAKILKYKTNCHCRKPETGLIIQASQKHQIDLTKSWFLGDGVNDILAGSKAGCKTILLANLSEFSEFFRILEEKLEGVKPDYIVKRLGEVQDILELE